MNRWTRMLAFSLAFTLSVIWTTTAHAQAWGLRGGFSVDPDQLYFGVHTESGPIYDVLRFRPNLEVGFGDNRTVVALNGEFVYPFALQNGTRLYVGGGPAINIVSRDRPNQPNRDDTDVQAGLNFLIGVNISENYFAELKVGAIDSPAVKIGFGYTFP